MTFDIGILSFLGGFLTLGISGIYMLHTADPKISTASVKKMTISRKTKDGEISPRKALAVTLNIVRKMSVRNALSPAI